MTNTNNAEAGPSHVTKLTKQPTLEFAERVEVYESTKVEDLLDYSILVSNNISMARDQLANERNWLTWFRLSCTLIILGKFRTFIKKRNSIKQLVGFTILIKFRLPDETQDTEEDTPFDVTNKPIGLIFCVIGFCCFFVGIGKYFKNQRLLVKQATYVEAGWGSYLMIALLFLFVCSVMIMASLSTAESFLPK
ncbi:unnamed protein product [Mucor hiemalis]